MPWIGTILLLAVLTPAPDSAPPEEVEVCALKVEASGTLASGEEPQMDETLAKFRRLLPKTWTYAAYTHLGQECKKLLVGQGAVFKLPGSYHLAVRREEGGDQVRLGCRLMKGKKEILPMGVRLGNGGGTWLGGPSLGKGTLYVLLSARW